MPPATSAAIALLALFACGACGACGASDASDDRHQRPAVTFRPGPAFPDPSIAHLDAAQRAELDRLYESSGTRARLGAAHVVVPVSAPDPSPAAIGAVAGHRFRRSDAVATVDLYFFDGHAALERGGAALAAHPSADPPEAVVVGTNGPFAFRVVGHGEGGRWHAGDVAGTIAGEE